MDIKQFKPYDWTIIAAGAVMLTLGFALEWASLGGISGNRPFDYFFTGGIAWLLVVGTAVVAALVAGRILDPKVAPWNLILVAAAALATVLMLLRLIMGGGNVNVGGGMSVSLDRGAGMYVAFIAAAAALGGAVWRFLDGGGDLKDFTSPDKLKGSFRQGS